MKGKLCKYPVHKITESISSLGPSSKTAYLAVKLYNSGSLMKPYNKYQKTVFFAHFSWPLEAHSLRPICYSNIFCSKFVAL